VVYAGPVRGGGRSRARSAAAPWCQRSGALAAGQGRVAEAGAGASALVVDPLAGQGTGAAQPGQPHRALPL